MLEKPPSRFIEKMELCKKHGNWKPCLVCEEETTNNPPPKRKRSFWKKAKDRLEKGTKD